MFDSSNRTPRRGGYRQDENPRERSGATMSADGSGFRPRFNPNATPQDGGGRKRQRFTRTAGATRVERVEARPSFRNANGQGANPDRPFRPRPKQNSEVYSQRKRQEFVKNYDTVIALISAFIADDDGVDDNNGTLPGYAVGGTDVAFGNISDRMQKIFEAIIAYVSYIIKVITRAIEVLPL